MAGVGATITSGGISPTFWLGQIFKLKRLDPEYVCAHCQGLEADEWLVTFCPECAELQRAVILTACPKCDFDLESKAPERLKGGAEPATPEPATPEPPSAPQPIATPKAGPFLQPVAPVWQTPSGVPLGRPAPGATPGTKRCQTCGRDYPSLWRVVIATPTGFEERFLCGSTPTCQMRSLVVPIRA